MNPRPVHWHQGMFLRPQHFQAGDRFTARTVAQNSRLDRWHGWGLRKCVIDSDALAGFPGTQVDTAIDDGSVVTAVTVADDTNTAAVAAVLNQYALRWHLNVRATDSVPVSD